MSRRPLIITTLVTISLGLTGCVSSQATDWAQTAPSLPPDEMTPSPVNLGVWPAPSAPG